jgi:D-alanyl-D-alanine carboxypeptidase (penicillin-binding protein 5/6)
MTKRPFQHVALALFLVVSLLAVPQAGYADIRDTDTIGGQPVGTYTATTSDIPDIQASYAGLCTSDGRMLWERDTGTPTPMASTTKIMTAVVALESTGLDTPMAVTVGAAGVDGSSAHLQPGDVLPLRDLLYAMMLPSGNDAAVVIAENIAGMEHSFANLMNDKAAALGMTSTRFSNASGLIDDDNYTTVHDYLILTRHAMQNATFREVVGSKTATIAINGQDVTYTSTNLLFDRLPGTLGIKTGFTDAAGYCLVSAARQNGIELYCVVFHTASEEQRFIDSQALLEWGFRHYRPIELINTSQQVGEMGLTSWIDKSVAVYPAQVVTINLFDLDGPINQEIDLSDHDGSIRKGDACGSIVWTQGGDVLAEVGLVSSQTVETPDFWQGVVIWWQRLWGGFNGEATHIATELLLQPTLEVPANQ